MRQDGSRCGVLLGVAGDCMSMSGRAIKMAAHMVAIKK